MKDRAQGEEGAENDGGYEGWLIVVEDEVGGCCRICHGGE